MPKTNIVTSRMRRDLKRRGWTLHAGVQTPDGSAQARCLALAKEFGSPVATRGTDLVDVLTPQDSRLAKPRSLSAQSGTGMQPWHVDLSHRALPARYLVISCVRTGPTNVHTEFLDRHAFLSARDLADAASEPFLVRSGRNSFYATILERSKRFIRFDPGCMRGATLRASQLMSRLLTEVDGPSYVHQWAAGDILIVDNWRLLHRRADASASADRTLLRVTVMGEG